MKLLAQVPTIRHDRDDGALEIGLTAEELTLVLDALATVRREIDTEEFHTRLGVFEGEADSLRAKLVNIAANEATSDRPPDDGLTPESIALTVLRGELVLMNNALNEVVNGLWPDEGGLPHGSIRDRAAALLKGFHAAVVGTATAGARSGAR